MQSMDWGPTFLQTNEMIMRWASYIEFELKEGIGLDHEWCEFIKEIDILRLRILDSWTTD